MRRQRIFYGWWIVAAAVAGVLFGYSSFVSTVFGLFVRSLEDEFGWTRTIISGGATILTGMIVVLAPIGGALIDRFGVRRVLLPSLFAFGTMVAVLSTLNGSVAQMYVLFALIAVAGVGTQPLVFGRVVVSWFDRHRGLALGITLSGVGLAAAVLPSIVQPLIHNFGWRVAYLIQAALILGIAWPLAFFLVRDTPASMGLSPDGDEPIEASCAGRATDVQEGLTLRAAALQRPFWQMLLAFGLLGFISAGIITHLAPLLADRKFSAEEIALLLGFKGVSLVAGRVLCGLLVDRFFAPLVAALFLLCPAVGIALLATEQTLPGCAAALALIGLGFGAEFDLMAYLVSRYMGLRAYGRVYGLVYSAFGIGAAAGPLAMGWSFDQLGSYAWMLWIFATAPLAAAVLLGSLGPYRWGAARASKGPQAVQDANAIEARGAA